MDKIKLGISACLLGRKVRYDGQAKLDPFLRDTLGRYVDYVPVCPEVAVGLGVPRESMHLTGDPACPRLVTIHSGQDHSDLLRGWACRRIVELEKEGLCGFVFKSKSPSCGMERVKVYNHKGQAVKTGVGLFAAAFKERFPLLPVEEEGRLHDLPIRENFIESIFALKRWRDMIETGKTPSHLVHFHTTHKMLILSHSQLHYRQMGQLVANGHNLAVDDLFNRYRELLLTALRLKATRRKHMNVLQHIQGFFKKQLNPDEKQELTEIIAQFAEGSLPLIVPVTLLNHYVRQYGQEYLAGQFYLHPHPLELQLRNHG